MLTVSCEGQHEKVHCAEDEIILSGPPAFLTGYITFQNDVAEDVFIKDLRINHKSKQAGLTRQSIDINTMLSPKEVKSHLTSFSANPGTPPGTYESTINVGGKERKLKMIVQETMEIVLIPGQVTFMGTTPGQTHTKEVLLANKGNVPVVVPSVKHNTTLDMDLICRNLSLSIRETGDQGTEATLDHFVKGLKKDIAGWVEISIKEAGQIVKPGETKVLNISFKLPKDINEQRLYEGEIRILDQELDYRIIPSADRKTYSKAKASKPKK
jgi:hypothetical protein